MATRKASSNFGAGGVYTCRVCGKRTRATGRGDCEFIALCADCYDAAGIENAHADGDHAETPCADCPECQSAVAAS